MLRTVSTRGNIPRLGCTVPGYSLALGLGEGGRGGWGFVGLGGFRVQVGTFPLILPVLGRDDNREC